MLKLHQLSSSTPRIGKANLCTASSSGLRCSTLCEVPRACSLPSSQKNTSGYKHRGLKG